MPTSAVSEKLSEDQLEKLVAPQADSRKLEIIYRSVLFFGYLHVAAIYGVYLTWTTATWKTLLFQYTIYAAAQVGITAGAHRLWSHKAYKATIPLQILLMLMQSCAFQYNATKWAYDHRLHHRYSDTDADPHNATRGLFFSHFGWMFVSEHPEVKKRRRLIDISDVLANPVLKFQRRYGLPLLTTVCFVLPTLIPMYFWGERFNTAWHITALRYMCNLHASFLINSAGHHLGNKPYDQNIKPVQNMIVSFAAFGEGFHNYHHVFPWDYKAAELGNNFLNWTTLFIDFFAWIGWAYDLKTVSEDHIKSRSSRCGDGSNKWGFYS